jgi:membrane glycosyltransferase
MQSDPALGIVQHLTVGLPARSAFPRLFQFGMRAGMRAWATGQALWQGPDGPYWGHNAILRSAAFRDHCKLERLPDGSAIMSHDQVEAARMRFAGYKVCVWAGEDGSFEANPPALPEFLHRDSRWLAGNMQYWHLLRLPGFTAMGRWQLVQAMLLFAGAPLYTAILLLAALSAATGGGAATPRDALAALTIAWPLALYSPKLLAYCQVLLNDRARYGGAGRFAAGVLAETIFTLLLDAVATIHKTLAMASLALGVRPGWLAQNRVDRTVGWIEASRMFWPHSLIGLAAFAGFAASSWAMLLWAVPWVIGLVLAVPFCVLTANPGFSEWLARRRIAAVPEELLPVRHPGA